MHERDLIARIASLTGDTQAGRGVIQGIGDDCAVLAPGPGLELAVTTDTLVESVHFDLASMEPRQLGRKTASVNLSDIGAMGAVPRWAFLNVSMRRGLNRGFWDAFIRGLTERLAGWGASLVGGDTVSTLDGLSITLTLIGEVEPGRWLGRDKARAGDLVFLSGYIGESALGLAWLKRPRRFPDTTRPGPGPVRRVVSRHLDPEPRVELGRTLSRSGLVRAAIDLSDGLATDLAHICQKSGVAAVVREDTLPISRAARTMARYLGLSPVECAVSGGEDYELLWTVSPEHSREASSVASRVLGHHPFLIGRIVPGNGVQLESRRGRYEISFRGYEHVP